MQLIRTEIPEVCLIEPKVFGDARGFFYESWNRRTLSGLGIDAEFVQDNHSRSARNVLRGEITGLSEEGGRVMVRVGHADRELLCALTPDAVEALALQPGVKIYAVLKSVAIDGLGGGLLEALDG